MAPCQVLDLRHQKFLYGVEGPFREVFGGKVRYQVKRVNVANPSSLAKKLDWIL